MCAANAAIILAAGASVRMGRPKQLLEVDGKPLAVRAAEICLAAQLSPVIVVLGAHRERIEPILDGLPVCCVDNPLWSEGMASSLRTGIAAVNQHSPAAPGVVIALCDQPAFSVPVIAQLCGAAAGLGRGIAAARYAGRLGVPVWFQRRYFEQLAALTGDQGARLLLQQHADEVAAVDLPDLATDLDTPQDWSAFTEVARAHLPPRNPPS